MKTGFAAFCHVLTANSILILIGIVQSIILPKMLGPMEYGYWSMYLLYVSYAGFLLFGFCDGFYLKYAGIKYEAIDKKLFSTFHWLLILYLLIIFIVWILIIDNLFVYSNDFLIYFLIGIGGVLFNYRGFFILLNQTAGRFSIYAKGNIIEKTVIMIATIILIAKIKVDSFDIIIASLFGMLLTNIFFVYYSRDIIDTKTIIEKRVMLSVIDNIKVGIYLTISGISSMLITGFGRFFIEKQLGIIELGYYSLMFSFSALFLQMVNAASVVLFPILRRVSEVKAKYYLSLLDSLLIYLSGLLLLIYYPMRFLLELFFPQFYPAMHQMIFLFPILYCQIRIMIIYNTLYKVFRFERIMLKNTFIALIFCVIVTIIAFRIHPSREGIAFTTCITFYFWNLLIIFNYRKNTKEKVKVFNFDSVIILAFLLLNHIYEYSFYSFILILGIILFDIKRNYTRILKIISEFKKMI